MQQLRLATGLGALILLAAAYSNAQEKGAKTPNYYPLEVGNTWHYKVSVNGKDSNITTSVAKHEKSDKLTLARLESVNVTLTEHLAQTDKGLFRHRLNGADVSPPFNLIPYPPAVGSKWKGSYTVEKEQGKFEYQGEIVKEESIAVPAGKFKALQVQIKLQDGDKQVEINNWFVQDVGFVKQTFPVGNATIVLELEKFERKK